jgi:hypothetical protein
MSRDNCLRELMIELLSQDSFTRRCAADLAHRVSAREPGVLRERAGELIGLVAELPDEQWQARGWVTIAAALNASTHAQRTRLALLVRSQSEERRIGVRAIALEAFTILAAAEPVLRDEAMLMIERARGDEAFAMRIRARRTLPPLASESKASN